MNNKYDKLVKKFPSIFKDMKYVSCGEGWHDLIYTLCQEIIKNDPLRETRGSQVKEKFGGLRFYTYNGTENIFKLINDAEQKSYKICEVCGSKVGVKQTKGWIITLCKKHYKEYQNEEKNAVEINWSDVIDAIRTITYTADIEQFGEYREGLTGAEIKEYLHKRAPRRKIAKLIKQFSNIAGINTGAVTSTGQSLMYRHDVLRFANKVLLNKDTYFD